jgi:hypothetical protein
MHGGGVLHDVTCRTRWLRQTGRAVVQVAVPAVVVWAVLSGLGFGLVVLGGIACGVLLVCCTPSHISIRVHSGAS